MLVKRIVKQFELDLTGVNILTEAASGAYKLNPLIAAEAGANVYCVSKDSRFGSAKEVFANLKKDAEYLGLANRVHMATSPYEFELDTMDIVTNSGFVRPIDKRLVGALNSECVIPLMWETWECRESDFDLAFCKQNNILCLGTNESASPLDMDPYAGILAVKMLFDLNLEVYKNSVVLIGENKFAWRVYDYLQQAGCKVKWFSELPYIDETGENCTTQLEQFRPWFAEHGKQIDAILLADLVHDFVYTDAGGPLAPDFLSDVNPSLNVGVLAGATDTTQLLAKNINVVPVRTMPAHFMSYQLFDIGPAPIMELFAAGLKVGSIMSKYRKSGCSPAQAARAALAEDALVMDFEGALSWL